jgi:hypothetical protein
MGTCAGGHTDTTCTRSRATTVGHEGAQYMPDLPATASVLSWRETLRYAPSGAVTEDRGRSYYEWAGMAYAQSIVSMRMNGVI